MRHLIVTVTEDSNEWALLSEPTVHLASLIDSYIQKHEVGETMVLYLNAGFYRCDESNVVHLTSFANSKNTDDLMVVLWGPEKYFDKHFKRSDAIKSVGALLASLEKLPEDVCSIVTAGCSPNSR